VFRLKRQTDGENTDATIVGRDSLTDLALLKAEDASDLPVISQGESDSLRVGQPVVAWGLRWG
jgi:S1-C subfamily serine protease